MTFENNGAPLLCCFKLCASFQSHQWIQTGVTVWKRSIRVKMGDFFTRTTLKFYARPWKTIGHSSMLLQALHNFKAIGEFKLKLQSGNAQFLSQNQLLLLPCDLEIWQTTLKNNSAPLLCCFKLCESFHSHQWIQTGVTVRKRQIWVKIDDFFVLRDLKIWQMTLKNNRASPLCYFKLCASFQSHWWIQAGITVPKRPIWVKIDDFFSLVTLKFDGWSWKLIGHLF